MLTDAAMTFRQRAHLIDEFFADAELTPRERRDLWECLLAFDHLSWDGLNEQTAWYREEMAEQQRWHESQMDELNAWRQSQREELSAHLLERLEFEHARAELAERELATYVATAPTVATGPDRLLLRAVRVARRLASGSSRSAP